MLQRLFARLRWPLWRSARSRTQTAARAGVTAQPATAGGRHRRGGPAQPAPVVVRVIDRLAEHPLSVSERLAEGVDAIYVGPGGVPDLDDMSRLHGVSLPSGRATWDACAGAYGERKIIIGTRPSATPDV